MLFQKPAEVPGEPKLAEPKVDPKPPDSMPPDTKITEATRDEVFRMERKDVFKMSGDDDIQGKPSKVLDPKKAPPTPPPYQSRTGTTPPMRMLLEPGYVVHRRLYFEERNAERYGWDLGLVQPVVSLAYFYKDVLLYPAKLGSNRRERYDTNAGKYLPGAPVPYYLYPPEITLAGVALGAGVIIGTAVLLQ